VSLYSKVIEAEENGISCAICTIIETIGTTPRSVGSKMIVYQNGDITGSIGGGEVEKEIIEKAIELINDDKKYKGEFCIDKSDVKQENKIKVFIEPIIPNITVTIIGAGHIGQEVSYFASHLGWKVVLIDDRQELIGHKNIQYSNEILMGFSEENIERIVRKSGFYIFATRSSEIDIQILPRLIEQSPRYIGILGSSKRWENTKNKLIELGINRSLLDRIYSPIGLDIGAETPSEIAVSIISQIISIIHNPK
jgi:xanthine dehydrogenase accessory factor